MTRTNFLKTTSILALAGGLLCSLASADNRRDRVGKTIWQVERATETLSVRFRQELQARGLWKPRGAYASLFKRIATLENQGDNLVKYHKRGKGYAYMAKAIAITDANAHEAAGLARKLRVSRDTVSGIHQVRSMLHSLNGLCAANYREPRARAYGSGRRGGYEYDRRRDSYEGRRYQERPIRSTYDELRRIF